METNLKVYRKLKKGRSGTVDIIGIFNDHSSVLSSMNAGEKVIDSSEMNIYQCEKTSQTQKTLSLIGSVSSDTPYYNNDDGYIYMFINGTLTKKDYVPFPNSSRQLEIFDFVYSSKRMDVAPTITATSMYEICLNNVWNTEDSDGNPICKYNDIFVSFRGEEYYLSKTPTSTKDNSDARYKHEMEFVSERQILEQIYLFDVVQSPEQTIQKLFNTTTFSFFGNVQELAKRINTSLANSGITIYDSTLQRYKGYHVEIDSTVTSDEKTFEAMVSFENNFINEALNQIDETFNLSYYFDGKTIHIGSYQTDIPTVLYYGRNNALLSISKSNNTSSIINRVSAIGSETNIPYYYPNPAEDGFLNPNAIRDDGGTPSSVPSKILYEDGTTNDAFFKNKSSDCFVFGKECKLTSKGSKIIHDSSKTTIQSAYYLDATHKIGLYFNNGFPSTSNSTIKIWKDLVEDSSAESSLNNHETAFIEKGKIDIEISQNITNCIANKVGYYYEPSYKTIYIKTYSGKEEYTFCFGDDFYDEDNLVDGVVITTQFNEVSTVPLSYLDSAGIFFRFFAIKSVRPCKCRNFNGWWSCDDSKSIIERAEDCTYLDLNSKKIYKYDKKHDRYTEYSGAVSLDETVYSILKNNLDFGIRYYYNEWYRNNSKLVDLSTYGLQVSGTPTYLDKIDFTVDKYFTPQSNLMPSVFYNSEGEKRFYNAIQYPRKISADKISSELDETIGEYIDCVILTNMSATQPSSAVIGNKWYNKTDKKIYTYSSSGWGTGIEPDSNVQYKYNSVYYKFISNDMTLQSTVVISNDNYKDYDEEDTPIFKFENPYEKGKPKEHIEQFDDIKPSIVDMKYGNLEIDMIDSFAYDTQDSDSTFDAEDEDSSSVQYMHSYFCARLRPLGFNLFDCAIDEDTMKLEFTTGVCGSCSFEIQVKEDTNKNIVQEWLVDVYDSDGNVLYNVGDLVRYTDKDLYLSDGTQILNHETTNENSNIENSKKHFEGDIYLVGNDTNVDNGYSIIRNDTRNEYVWIALQKDTNTFGTIMPSRIQTSDGIYTSIRPTEKSDKFVLTSILLPQSYIRSAEQKLSREAIKYMAKYNSEIFNFNITFSRIFFEESDTNKEIADKINENSRLHIYYNGNTKIQMVSSYTYKVTTDSPLPEIQVELKENVNTAIYRSRYSHTNRNEENNASIERDFVTSNQLRKNYVSKKGDTTINGNIVVSGNVTGNINFLRNGNAVSVTDIDERVGYSDFPIDGTILQRTNANEENFGFSKFSIAESYVIGDIIKRNGKLYRFTLDHSANNDFDESEVEETSVNVFNNEFRIDEGIYEFSEDESYGIGEYTLYKGRVYQFRKSHTGSWNVSDVKSTTIRDLVFNALGYEEFQPTNTYSIGSVAYRNGKLYRFTKKHVAGEWDSSHVIFADNLTENISRFASNNTIQNMSKKVDSLTALIGSNDSEGIRKTLKEAMSNISKMSNTIKKALNQITQDQNVSKKIGGFEDDTITIIQNATSSIDDTMTVLDNGVHDITFSELKVFMDSCSYLGTLISAVTDKFGSTISSELVNVTLVNGTAIVLIDISSTTPTNPNDGDIYYNTSTNSFYQYKDNSWKDYDVEDMKVINYFCKEIKYHYNGSFIESSYYKTSSDNTTAMFISIEQYNEQMLSYISDCGTSGISSSDLISKCTYQKEYENVADMAALYIHTYNTGIMYVLDWETDKKLATTYRFIYYDTIGDDTIYSILDGISGYNGVHIAQDIIYRFSNGEIWSMYAVEYLIAQGKATRYWSSEDELYTYHGLFIDSVINFIASQGGSATRNDIISNFGGGDVGAEYMYTVYYLVDKGILKTLDNDTYSLV